MTVKRLLAHGKNPLVFQLQPSTNCFAYDLVHDESLGMQECDSLAGCFGMFYLEHYKQNLNEEANPAGNSADAAVQAEQGIWQDHLGVSLTSVVPFRSTDCHETEMLMSRGLGSC